MPTYDDFIPFLGEFGSYQKRVLLYACILVIPTGAHIFAQVFLGARTDHWCATPSQWKSDNCSQWGLNSSKECESAKKDASIPPGAQCSRYDLEYDIVDFSPDLMPTDYTNDTATCVDGWAHDRTHYISTIVQDYDLVCEKKALPDMAQSIFAAGFLTGSFVFGWLADWLGRHPALFIAVATNAISGTLLVFSPNLAVYIAIRFVIAASTMGLYFVAFVCATEYVGPSKRTLVGVLMANAYALGYMILAGLAFFIRDWRTLELIISVPLFLLLAFIPVFPESARWLLTRGDVQRAKPILSKAASCNKVILPNTIFEEHDITQKKTPCEEKTKSPSFVDILRYPAIRWRTFNMMFNWFVNNMVYYGLSLSTSSLGTDEFVAAFLSAAVEIPAYTSSLFIIDRWGRRVPLCTYLVGAGVCVISTIWLPLGPWRTTIAMIGKFMVSASYGVVYIFAAEIFPTPVRSIGLGACAMSSHLSGIITPMILSLGLILWEPLPLLIFGVASILAGFLALLFPETLGHPLLETLEECEAFGKKNAADLKATTKTKDGLDYDRISMKDMNEGKTLHKDAQEAGNNVNI